MNALDLVTAAVAEALVGPCAVPEGARLLVACSGGADSVALVAAIAALAPRWSLHAVAFVDHGLRDVALERGAAERAAERARAPFVTLPVTVAPRGNVQAHAREARYAALITAAGPSALVATAHTATDQAETVLQRIIRGSGLRGLAAIAAREGRIVRPLMTVSRTATRSLGLDFVDDPSNATGKYQRNRLRHGVMPLLAAENPQIERALAAVAATVRAELELLDALAGAVDLAAADLRGVPAPLAEVLVRWRHRREIGGAPLPGEAASQLAQQLVAATPDAATSLGRGWLGHARRGRLSFAPERDPRLEVVAHGPGTYRLATLQLELLQGPPPAVRGGPGDVPTGVTFPAEGLRWPLKIKRRRTTPGMPVATRDVGDRGPDAPAANDPEPGARTTGFLITDALGGRVWPPEPGASPAVCDRWMWLRASEASS